MTHQNTKHQGFTLIELLITLIVGSLVISAAVSVTIASNRMFRIDRARTRMNQDLRAASDLIGADVRTAGAGLPAVLQQKTGVGEKRVPGFQPILVRNGNELEIRRSVIPISLPVCDSIKANSSKNVVKIGSPGNSGVYAEAECDDEARDIDGDGMPEDLAQWIAYRTDTDVNPNQTVSVYIWPASDGSSGEFFTYDREDNSKQQIHRASGKWEHNYDWDSDYKPKMYVLEMRRYRLNEGVLELIINDDEANPLRLVNNISDFQVRVVLDDGSVIPDFGSGEDHYFTNIASIEINVTAENQVSPDQLVSRELNNRFFPRNALNF